MNKLYKETIKSKMFKKLLLTSVIISSLIGIIYPNKKENTKLFDYCFSLEKILSRNSVQKRKNLTSKVMSISKDIAKFGVSKTRGALIHKIINQYKTSKNSSIINLVPNDVYCLGGYWIEKIKPGTFELVFYKKSKKAINEFKDLKDEVGGFINNINSEYKSIEKEFNNFFKK